MTDRESSPPPPLRQGAWWRRAGWALLVTALFWAGIWGGVKLVEALRAARQMEVLSEGGQTLQRAIERYAVDHQGAYPEDLVELFLAEYLKQMPRSPFGGELLILTPRSTPVPGGVDYISWSPSVAPTTTPADDTLSQSVEADSYILVIYGSTDRGASPPKVTESRSGSTPVAKPPPGCSRIAWDRVWVLIQSGEDPVSL